MRHSLVPALLLAALTGCASAPATRSVPSPALATSASQIELFSTHPTEALPDAWEPMILLRTKKLTQYRLVRDSGKTVLHAEAKASSSGLMQRVSIDPLDRPWLSWEWKIAGLIRNADNFDAATEDSPVRIVLGFDGDKSELPFSDQILFETAKLLTGRDLPYATLIYIWENKAPLGTIIPNSRTKRIQKLVVASGGEGVAQWQRFTRNIAADYQMVFGEKPGRLIGIGVLTDTDNTGETVQAWYGDIHLTGTPPQPAVAEQ